MKRRELITLVGLVISCLPLAAPGAVVRHLVMEWSGTGGDIERTCEYAEKLVRLAPYVLLSNGTPATAALKNATSTIPIVFAVVNDPVAQGFIPSMAHPG